jgi:HEAT repeat protein
VPDLVRALGRSEDIVVKRVCWALGDIKDSSAVEGLMQVCDHPSWWVREYAVEALGKIGDGAASEVVLAALKDTIGQVRKSAVVSSGQLQINEAVEELAHSLGDDFYGARLMAVSSLLRLDTALVLQTLADSLISPNRLVGDLACQVLGEIGSDEAMALLLTQLSSIDPNRRAQAAVALVTADPLDNCGFRKNYLDRETDRLVRLKIESALKNLEDEK